jgi:hypothetical protein
MPTTVRGRYFYWYMMKDIYSRKLVMNEVWEEESAGVEHQHHPAHLNGFAGPENCSLLNRVFEVRKYRFRSKLRARR